MRPAARSARSPDSVDRILIGVCVLIWLAVLGVGVAATVVLVDMGSGRHAGGSASRTPWLLYAVIAVSAVIILGAIPLLVRARHTALDAPGRGPVTPSRAVQRSAPRSGAAVSTRTGTEAPTEKLRVFGSIADPTRREPLAYRRPESAPRRLPGGLSERTVQRLFLRATVVIVGAMGVATLAVAAATYLMGVDKDVAAYVSYGVATVVTVATPVIPWVYLRQLRAAIVARPA
jgi:Protein of unknown function (DUF2561)